MSIICVTEEDFKRRFWDFVRILDDMDALYHINGRRFMQAFMGWVAMVCVLVACAF